MNNQKMETIYDTNQEQWHAYIYDKYRLNGLTIQTITIEVCWVNKGTAQHTELIWIDKPRENFENMDMEKSYSNEDTKTHTNSDKYMYT